jgi:hypothetical protein
MHPLAAAIPARTVAPATGAQAGASSSDPASGARFAALINESPRDVPAPAVSTNFPERGADRDVRHKAPEAMAFPYFAYHAAPAATDVAPVATAPTSDEITDLLQRVCSAIYVGEESSVTSARIVLALDTALPGATVEFIREGAFLQVRLHARNDTTFRLMSNQRDSLHAALGNATRLNVTVDVIRDEGAPDGRAG